MGEPVEQTVHAGDGARAPAEGRERRPVPAPRPASPLRPAAPPQPMLLQALEAIARPAEVPVDPQVPMPGDARGAQADELRGLTASGGPAAPSRPPAQGARPQRERAQQIEERRPREIHRLGDEPGGPTTARVRRQARARCLGALLCAALATGCADPAPVDSGGARRAFGPPPSELAMARDRARMARLAQTTRAGAMAELLRSVEHPEAAEGWREAALMLLARPQPAVLRLPAAAAVDPCLAPVGQRPPDCHALKTFLVLQTDGRLVDLVTDRAVSLEGFADAPPAKAFFGTDRRVVFAGDGRRWDARTGAPLPPLAVDEVLALSPDGSRLAARATGDPRRLDVLDADTGAVEGRFPVEAADRLRVARFATTGRRLFAIDRRGRVWDARTGASVTAGLPVTGVSASADQEAAWAEERQALDHPAGFSPDLGQAAISVGHRVAVVPLGDPPLALADLVVDFDDVVEGIAGLIERVMGSEIPRFARIVTHRHAGEAATPIVFSPDGGHLAYVDEDCEIGSVPPRSGFTRYRDCHDLFLSDLAFSAEGRSLSATDDDGARLIWDVRPLPIRMESLGPGDGVIGVSTDGRTVAMDAFGSLEVWVDHHRRWPELDVKLVALTPDGSSALVQTSAGSLDHIGLGAPSTAESRTLTRATVGGVTYDPVGTWAAASTRGRVRLWDLSRGTPPEEIPHASDEMAIDLSLAVHRGRVAAILPSGLRVWARGPLSWWPLPLPAFPGRPTRATLSPDGQWLAVQVHHGGPGHRPDRWETYLVGVDSGAVHGLADEAATARFVKGGALFMSTYAAITRWTLPAEGEAPTRAERLALDHILTLGPSAGHVVLRTQSGLAVLPLGHQALIEALWCHRPRCLDLDERALELGEPPAQAATGRRACLAGLLARAEACDLPPLVAIAARHGLRQLDATPTPGAPD